MLIKELHLSKDDVYTHLYTPEHMADPMIDNPDFKGKWVHPMVPSPEYDADEVKETGKYKEACTIGFDLWQVKSGTIFDNVLVTDDPEHAKKVMPIEILIDS